MWRSKKFIVIAVLVTLPIIVLMLLGEGCTQAVDSDASKAETETTVNENPDRMRPQMNLDEVAEVLGIEQQKLEDVFAQAQSEMRANMSGNGQPPATPRGEPSTGVPPAGMSPGPGLPDDLLARVAEILNIDQQRLEDAFAQAQSTDSAQ